MGLSIPHVKEDDPEDEDTSSPKSGSVSSMANLIALSVKTKDKKFRLERQQGCQCRPLPASSFRQKKVEEATEYLVDLRHFRARE